MKKKEFEAKAKELCARYNPYAEKRDYSTPYFVDGTPMFLFMSKKLTKAEMDAEYIETAVKDMQAGYKERMVGYYDKWYRYSRADEGAAYDAGQQLATQNPKCSKTFTIIEIAECNR